MPGRKQSRRLAAAVAMAAAVACSHGASAQPAGATVVVGGAHFQQLGTSLLVTTTNGPGTQHSVIDWRSFSVPARSITHFQQPGVDSTSINRVTGNKPSEILGTLSSNGRLVLVNPSGIAVGKDAVIDTAGFTASALSLADDDAVAGRLRFSGGKGKASVSVAGAVLARAGDLVLVGTDVQVEKDAVMRAPDGAVILAAGQRVALTGRGLEGIVLELSSPQDRAVNLGHLEGDAVGIFAAQLRHTGVIQAQHVVLQGDKIRLENGGSTDKADANHASAPPPSIAQASTGVPPGQAKAILSALMAHDSQVIASNGEVVAGLEAPPLPGDDPQERRKRRAQPDPLQQCTR